MHIIFFLKYNNNLFKQNIYRIPVIRIISIGRRPKKNHLVSRVTVRVGNGKVKSQKRRNIQKAL